MANQYLYQFLFSKNVGLSLIQGSALFGASGAITSSTGTGVTSVTKLADGVFSINLTDSWARLLNTSMTFKSPVTGANVASTALVTGTLYEITAVGTTDWTAVGMASNVTAAVGVAFVATGTAAGTGTAKAVSQTGIFQTELAGDPQTMITPVTTQGGHVIIRTSDATGALTNPASGSVLFFDLLLRNSKVAGRGE